MFAFTLEETTSKMQNKTNYGNGADMHPFPFFFSL